MPNALSAQPNQMPMQAQQAPAPNHVQTMALLRHFDMIEKELVSLLANPNLGKADVHSDLIDAATKLVSQRIIAPTQAVSQMAGFPERPFEQKTWVVNMMQQNTAARAALLQHHGDYQAPAGPPPKSNPDNHMQDVSGAMQAHYPQAGQ